MKFVVAGGTGLIGSKLISCLREEEYEAVAASPSTGVDTLTGDGLGEVLEEASVVVDVSNSPSFEDEAVMDFFTTSTANLLAAEAVAGVRHHVALSVVGAERLTESGYLRAKVAQEELIRDAVVPFTIVRATQFFEFMRTIADSATEDRTVRLPQASIQPVAADDVAAALCEISQRPAADRVIEIAGPEQFQLDEFVRHGLMHEGDPRTVVGDPTSRYFGARPHDRALLPTDVAHLGSIRFEDWLGPRVRL
jgi:uncharacterized protein YbjT (DUF2867 family)